MIPDNVINPTSINPRKEVRNGGEGSLNSTGKKTAVQASQKFSTHSSLTSIATVDSGSIANGSHDNEEMKISGKMLKCVNNSTNKYNLNKNRGQLSNNLRNSPLPAPVSQSQPKPARSQMQTSSVEQQNGKAGIQPRILSTKPLPSPSSISQIHRQQTVEVQSAASSQIQSPSLSGVKKDVTESLEKYKNNIQFLNFKVEKKKTLFDFLFGWITKSSNDAKALQELNKLIYEANEMFLQSELPEMLLFLNSIEIIKKSDWMKSMTQNPASSSTIQTVKSMIESMNKKYQQKCKDIVQTKFNDPIIQRGLAQNANKDAILAARRQIERYNQLGWGISPTGVSLSFDKITFFSEVQIRVLKNIAF